MSEPKPWDLWEVILEETDSKWVRWEDYARIKADNIRLKEAVADSYKAVDEMDKKFKELEGEFELHPMATENARLKAEVERLRKFNDEALAHIAKEERKIRECLDMAQAEVERLTKAGDAMAEALKLNDDVFDNHEKKLAQAAWNAAKEGKPQP
jgi:predicted nuclease with TOPRIM domain